MKQVYSLIISLTALCYFSACQQKMICPAYHSYFILDVEETRNTFSLFGADSLPKNNWEVDKEKYGIAKAVSNEKKLRDMRIISMNSVYKKIEDPFEQFKRSYPESDSGMIYIDSAAVLSASRGDNDFQNIDQMIYLHHFSKYLPVKNNNSTTDELLKKDLREEEEEPLISDQLEEPVKKKKGLFGFMKKNKNKSQDEEESGEDLEEQDQ